MTTDALFEVTRTGLDFERARMDAASRRIALANSPVEGNEATKGAGFAGHVQAAAGGAPAAADGATAPVDLAQEMTTLMSAQRAYQADIRAFNTLHGMMMKSLDIGRSS